MYDNINKIYIPNQNKDFMVIAGPCSAESHEQVMSTANGLLNIGINIFRAGVWKPRTMPNGFEGIGDRALPWLGKVQNELGMNVMVEVGTVDHIKKLRDVGINMFWIGARTTVNPFLVNQLAQEIAQDNESIVFVKNPINPDLNLWIGAILRLQLAGVKNIGAIHRGFSSYGVSQMRNPPYWQIALELKKRMPNITLLCDPSHISGNSNLILPISKTALEMSYDGIMVETHCNPENALSDANQQITPERLGEILNQLNGTVNKNKITNELSVLRKDIDHIDEEIIGLLARRFALTEKMGKQKRINNIPILQLERFNKLLNDRLDMSAKTCLREEFIRQLFGLIHEESVYQQELNTAND